MWPILGNIVRNRSIGEPTSLTYLTSIDNWYMCEKSNEESTIREKYLAILLRDITSPETALGKNYSVIFVDE